MDNSTKNFVLQALKDGHRIDGRAPYDFRPISLTFGSNYGNVMVQLGSTRVLANVSAEIVRPFPDSPNNGRLVFNTVFSPMAAPEYEADRPNLEEALVSRALEKVLRRSRAVDTEGLCIISGEKAWLIRVDIRLLDDDGNVLDCACIAAMSALLHFRRPDVTVQGDSVTVVSFPYSPFSTPFNQHFNGILTCFSIL
jgi:exosome complex component RRP45